MRPDFMRSKSHPGNSLSITPERKKAGDARNKRRATGLKFCNHGCVTVSRINFCGWFIGMRFVTDSKPGESGPTPKTL